MADRAYITIVELDADLDNPLRARQRLGFGVPETPQFAYRFDGTRLVLSEAVMSKHFVLTN